jgi:Icc-related predicted phosphoesterase
VRLLLASDLHYSLRQLDWILGVADTFDVVVLAGDLLDIRSYVEPDAQIVVVLEYLGRIAAKTTVAACSGNHDLNARNEHDEQAAAWLADARTAGVCTDGAGIIDDDVLLTVFPWWDGPRTRDDVDALFASEAARRGDREWIWVYHAPPDQSPTSWTGRRHYGDPDLNTWIDHYQPSLVCCGHVHESPFAPEGGWSDRIGDTWVVNAGRQPGPVPAHAVIDTAQRRITWFSATGIDDVEYARE